MDARGVSHALHRSLFFTSIMCAFAYTYTRQPTMCVLAHTYTRQPIILTYLMDIVHADRPVGRCQAGFCTNFIAMLRT